MHFKYGDGNIKKYYRTNKYGERRTYWRGRIYINQKQVSVYAKTQAECLNKLKALRKERNENTRTNSNSNATGYSKIMSYSEWLDNWVKLCKEEKLKDTYKGNFFSNLKIIKENLGQYKLKDLKPLIILTYIKSLPRRNLTVKLFDIINSSLQKAEDFDIIQKNPCKAIDRPTYEQQKRRAFEPDEQTAILNALEGKHCRAFFFLCATGLRIGEFLALTEDNFDVDRGIIYIKASMDIQTGQIVPPKTKTSVRQVYFTPQLLEIFNIEDLGHYTYSGIKKAFIKVYRDMNLENISLTHSCRHTYASLLCATGLPVKIIQTQIGHAAFSTTMDIYTDVLIKGSSPIYDYIIELKDFIKQKLL